jgi:hypothetical protein
MAKVCYRARGCSPTAERVEVIYLRPIYHPILSTWWCAPECGPQPPSPGLPLPRGTDFFCRPEDGQRSNCCAALDLHRKGSLEFVPQGVRGSVGGILYLVSQKKSWLIRAQSRCECGWPQNEKGVLRQEVWESIFSRRRRRPGLSIATKRRKSYNIHATGKKPLGTE